MKIYNKKFLLFRRRELRRKMTEAEKILWSRIRNKQLKGKKFRRQYSIGGYILDFYCPEAKLAVEIDGPIHRQEISQKYDSARTKFLNALGVKVLRFTNEDILTRLDEVLREIEKFL